MEKILQGLFIGLLAVSVLTCDDNQKNEPRFLEGQEIPNTRYLKPLEVEFAPFADQPVISPNGQWIAYRYTDTASNNHGLYRMHLSTYEKKLIINNYYARNHDWSPDSEWIVFNIDAQIYKIKANGDSLTQLTFDGRNFFPDWSPDGKKIVYDRSLADQSGPGGIWLMYNDGTQKKSIFGGAFPDWYPSGNTIIAVVGVSSTTIWTKFARYEVTSNIVKDSLDAIAGGSNEHPQYSPDGSRILFINDDGIWIMNSDGTNPKRILPTEHYNEKRELVFVAVQPSWHPDGRHIVYLHQTVTKHIRCEETRDGYCPDFDPKEFYTSFYLLDVDSALAVSNL